MNTTPDAQSEMRKLLHETCPERRTEIDKILKRHRVRFIYNDESPMAFKVCKPGDYAEIYIPGWTSHSLLAHTRAYLAIYDATVEVSRTWPRVPVSAQPALQRALALLDWEDRWASASPDDRNTILTDWPNDEPEPFAVAGGDDSLELANHLVWMATGYILLHELGHLEKGHFNPEHRLKKGAEIYPLEIEADEWARTFLMEKWQQYCASEYPDRAEAVELVRMKRLMGPIIGFLCIVRHEQRHGTASTHPPSYRRLTTCLDDYVADEPDHLVWALAQSIFWVHLKRAQPEAQPGEYETHRECAKALADALDSTSSASSA